MSISCKCLNIIVKLIGSDTKSLRRFDLELYLSKKRPQQQQDLTTKATIPSDDHFLFFKEALGPIRCATDIQFDSLLRKVRIFEEWDLIQCRNCECTVSAQNINECISDFTSCCLVNASLMITQKQLNARRSDENYSPAFGILLNGSSLSYSDLVDKSKLLNNTKSDNQFVRLLRSYMERETEAANEQIHRFTEQQFAVLKVKRERAEQDCLILAKLSNNVPELLQHINSSSSNNSTVTVQSTTTTNSTERATNVRNSVSPMATTGTNESSAGSQLETPPPTPEYLPMSTGHSPPLVTATSGNSRQQVNAVVGASSTSSSVSTADQSSSPSPGVRLNASTRAQNKANFSIYNNSNNNNNIVSFSNTHGAINRQQPTLMMMQMTATMAASVTPQQHSSTHSQKMQHQRLIDTNPFESDCMFDIDGMENDKSTLSNNFSDEEDLGFDDSVGNNNDDGIYIPSRQLGRQNSSIAKSLPISMPQAMTQFRVNEEDFEEMSEDNVDIAASIKALARSVHGDTVFGDLPRPQIQRFSTQI
ncbi:uncharacterized protein LOC131434726 isoform X2 [Malaya genurostris]|uniref:uncharacterized protein LOC131434726 isoform X2 n=1 Tax=Malaya genurostris TaxID=325434 RepID=UPI0026F3F368|nr:uncharacterized protein LOC131434726 isoform X2 [Malaya genurostris]